MPVDPIIASDPVDIELQPAPPPPPLPSSAIYQGTSPFVIPMMQLAAPTAELVVKPSRKGPATVTIASLPPLEPETNDVIRNTVPSITSTSALAPPKAPVEYPSDLEPEEDDPVTLPPLMHARARISPPPQSPSPPPSPPVDEPTAASPPAEESKETEPEARPVPLPSQMLVPFGISAEEHQRRKA